MQMFGKIMLTTRYCQDDVGKMMLARWQCWQDGSIGRLIPSSAAWGRAGALQSGWCASG